MAMAGSVHRVGLSGVSLFAGLPHVYGALVASTGCNADIRRRTTCIGWPQVQRQAGRGVDALPGAPGEARRCSSCTSRIAPALLGCREPKFEFDNGRAWKRFDFGVMEALFAKGLITDPQGKQESGDTTEAGLVKARSLAQSTFGKLRRPWLNRRWCSSEQDGE